MLTVAAHVKLILQTIISNDVMEALVEHEIIEYHQKHISRKWLQNKLHKSYH